MSRAGMDRENEKFGYSTLWESYINRLKPITWIYELNVKADILKGIPSCKNEDEEDNIL
ncbi:hypothetical protein QR721_12200 [Aciduricibacillus chroicocephali]|uniref:Uncharacterized protein n=1 Tax=Aciduricibacillus chroicocephali TaxID=3054939 RepID=A0ABY9KU80_9BACI|nr:hypothetical protein QR721_12200 [Bacillaceae bacterium 44XB]